MNGDYIPAQVWRDRALFAEKRAADAMDCLKKMGDCKDIPEPWRTVVQCAYIGCGGVNHWVDRPPIQSNGDRHA